MIATALHGLSAKKKSVTMVEKVTGVWIGDNLKWLIPLVLSVGWVFVLHTNVSHLTEDVADLKQDVKIHTEKNSHDGTDGRLIHLEQFMKSAPNGEVIQLQLKQMSDEIQELKKLMQTIAGKPKSAL